MRWRHHIHFCRYENRIRWYHRVMSVLVCGNHRGFGRHLAIHLFLLLFVLAIRCRECVFDQVQKQIYKLIDVVKVKVFDNHDVVCRELMLIKVKASASTRSQIVQIADVYRGNVLDISPTSMIIEVIGSVEKLRGFIQIMETYGILEIAKTGITAMSRGEKM